VTSSLGHPQGLATALWLVVALSLAGVAHVLWLKTAGSRRLSQPLDGGVTFRGRRLFGANKMLRGLVMMPLASSLAFAFLGGCREAYPTWLALGLWNLGAAGYAALGFACGLAFIVAELPNSFLKRQLGVEPGAEPRQGWLRPICLVLDRSDSTLGVLAVATLLVPVSATTWIWMLLLGPLSHAAFRQWMYRALLKPRAL